MIPRLDKDNCVFAVIDLQEKVLPIQHRSSFVISNIERFIRGANYFKIPILVIEQNPDKLGRTPKSITELAYAHTFIEKKTISCFNNNRFKEVIGDLGRKQLILTGSETQICVQKTALDGINSGYDIFVLGDGVTSRTGENVDRGLSRMAQSGVVIESTEGALFEFVERADDEDFKTVLKIIK